MKLLLNEEVQQKKWKELLTKSKFASPFQTPEYYKFFNSVEGFSADVFAIEKDNEYKVLVVVTIQKEKGIKGYFSRRGIIYGGPVATENEQNSLGDLLEGINKFYKRKLIYLETRNYFDYFTFKNQFEQSNFKYLPWLNFHLKTSDLTLMKKSVSSSRLRQIKKAIKNDAVWKEAESIDDVNVFYDILLDLYKNRIKKPLFDREFFIEFYKQSIGKYLLVYHKDKVIGGIVCPIMPNSAIYELYVCGLDGEYKNQYPSVMATWAAMEYANQNNIPLFDFMGAGEPDKEYGVREFKSRFGGEQVEYGRFIHILNPFLYKVGVAGLKLISKLRK
jgi:lipid II:glycine glycyltransferase (peptidoglycan interpeptide bridge formation enzyme)